MSIPKMICEKSNINDFCIVKNKINSKEIATGNGLIPHVEINSDKPIFDDFELISDSQYFCDDFQHNLAIKFLNQINSLEEVDIELMGKIMDILYSNPSFAKVIIDVTLTEKKNPVIVFRNNHNMQHFANILNSITLNLDHRENEEYELNFAIIHIAERSFFQDEANGNKFYLCAMLSKNKLFSLKTYWIELMELKLSKKMDNYLTKIINTPSSKNILIIIYLFLSFN